MNSALHLLLPAALLPLRLDRGEADATLAHRMGEGLGVRAKGEVEESNRKHQPPHLPSLLC